jgi:pimeloyl-ACP methyl ester carboxylesterase
MMVTLALLSILAAVVAVAAAPALAVAAPADPHQLPPTGDCVIDNIFYGDVPPGGGNGKVIVFVHGLSGLAEDWWKDNTAAGLNDMYILAYEAGYRTAFVNLNIMPDTVPPDCLVQRRPANDMIGNGKLLHQQIDAITAHYSVDQVDIVSHSKGGIDAQAAVVWWDTWPKVRNIFTLATPHQGALVADLIWSPEGLLWSILLDQRDQATYSMQTSSMQIFRSLTDPMTVDDAIHYYSAAGDFWDTPGTAFSVIGAWLQSQPDGGDNDGAVTVISTELLGAERLFLRHWNHAEMAQGHNAFPYIQSVLLPYKNYLPLLQAPGPTAGAPSVVRRSSSIPPSASILRSGRLDGPTRLTLPIEPHARSAHFTLLTSAPAAGTLIGPDGKASALPAAAQADQGFLSGAFVASDWVRQPAPGQWRIDVDGPPGTGYLLMVVLDSDLRVELEGLPQRPLAPGQPWRLCARSQSPDGAARVTAMQTKISQEAPGTTRSDASASVTTMGEGTTLSQSFANEGMYGASITVRGDAGSFPFERSFIRSLAVASPATLADPAQAWRLLSADR